MSAGSATCTRAAVGDDSAKRNTILTLSTIAFTLMFAVWLMFGVLGIPIRKEFGLTEVQFGWLTAIAILNVALGFAQEFRAEKAMAALRRLASPLVRVRRHGEAVLPDTTDVAHGAILPRNTKAWTRPSCCR